MCSNINLRTMRIRVISNQLGFIELVVTIIAMENILYVVAIRSPFLDSVIDFLI